MTGVRTRKTLSVPRAVGCEISPRKEVMTMMVASLEFDNGNCISSQFPVQFLFAHEEKHLHPKESGYVLVISSWGNVTGVILLAL